MLKVCLITGLLTYLLVSMVPHTPLTSEQKSPCVNQERLSVLETEVAEQRELIKALITKSQEVVVPMVSNASVETGLGRLSKKEELVLKWVEVVKREIVLVTKLFDPGFKDKLDVTETKLVKELDDLVRGIKGEEGCLREGFVKGVVEGFEIEWEKDHVINGKVTQESYQVKITLKGYLSLRMLLNKLRDKMFMCFEYTKMGYNISSNQLVFINTHYIPYVNNHRGNIVLSNGVILNGDKMYLMAATDLQIQDSYTLGWYNGYSHNDVFRYYKVTDNLKCINTQYTLDTSFFKELC